MAITDERTSPPSLSIPESAHMVRVSCIDSTSRFEIPMSEFLQPDYANQPLLHGPSYSFLIEHASQGTILFDLGIRKDWEVLPSAPKFRRLKWKIDVAKDVAAILQENGIDVAGGAIKSIIWSHHHWDHVGDPSRFPPSTELVVGPGFVKAHLPGYPLNPDSTLLESDYAGRNVREVDFFEMSDDTAAGLQIGRFWALDYFGDGSFYLLDTPGHAVGHICGLARTSVQPSTFVFLGGDAAHHGGEFRPTEYLPVPKEIDASLLRQWRQRHPQHSTCPGHVLQGINPHASATRPYYYVTEHFAHDKGQVEWTLAGLGEFDAQPNVLLLIAHDNTLGGGGEDSPAMLDLYPHTLNDWSAKGIGEKIRWTFLRDFDAAVVAKEKGEPPFRWKYQQ